jgi:hypothetical protein
MLALRLLWAIPLAALTAGVFVFVFLYVLSKSLDWLYVHYGTTIRRLRRLPPEESGKDSGQARAEGYYLIYRHYMSYYASIIYKRVSDALHIHIQCPKENRASKCYKANKKWFTYPPWRGAIPVPSQARHIVAIVNKLKGRVNQSGKEPSVL